MHSVTSNAVAEALQYKDDWQIGQIILTDKFFQGNRLKNYCDVKRNCTSGQVSFDLPEVSHNIVDMKISATDGSDNVIQDGYDDNVYVLRSAWIKASNRVVVSWSGWTVLNSVFLFFTYR